MKRMDKYYITASCVVGFLFIAVIFLFKYLIEARLFTQGLQTLPFIFLLVFLPLFLMGIIRSWIRIEKITINGREIRRLKLGRIKIELKATIIALGIAAIPTSWSGIFLGTLDFGYTKIYYLLLERQYEDKDRDALVLEAMESLNLNNVIPELPADQEVLPPFPFHNETGLRYTPRIYNISYFASISLHNSSLNVATALQDVVNRDPYIYGTSYPYFEGYRSTDYSAADFDESKIWTFGNGTWNLESSVANFTINVTWLVSVHYQYFSIWSEIDVVPRGLFIIDVILGTNSSQVPVLIGCLPPLCFRTDKPWTC